ncbi:hypothetical protein Dsin_023641 [Dipteronia sinensis]|uniref:RNase H type-1 domain-containing protein n=1 Tax=Dipteronia sinensis TaxID=43782 RepID=A0AAE0A5A1_9ROSI|nr:hypothetical protein Dsin_023641 [Dipteronia sinensis]
MLFLQPRLDYLMNARRILRCFELVSGLRLNFNKTCVVRVCKGNDIETNWAALFRCGKATLPITYLGLPLGGQPCSKLFWSHLIQRLEYRLPWKKMFLNKGGRRVLVKAVMSSIPNYFISVSKYRVIVGRGNRASLWSDISVEGKPLKEVYPRIFSLAKDKVGNVRESGRGWAGICPKNNSKRVWASLFFAVVWTILETRNVKAFKQVEASLVQASNMVKLRVSRWFKNLGNGSTVPITILLLDIADRSDRGSPGIAGIGGILRNHNGSALGSFSANVGVQDAIIAEVLAIAKACDLILSKTELEGKRIVILSDSTVAVSWINGNGLGNIKLTHVIYEISSILGSLGQATVEYRSRATNSCADALAKKGSAVTWNLD